MNSRFLKTVVLAAVIVGGVWILFNRDKIQKPADVVDLVKQKFSSRDDSAGPAQNALPPTSQFSNQQQPIRAAPNQPTPRYVTNVIRIASFKLNPQIVDSQSDSSIELLARICRRYDAVAIQDIGADDDGWVARLTERINNVSTLQLNDPRMTVQNRSQYVFISDNERAVGQPIQSTGLQSAIVFNRRTLHLDQPQRYSVNDPDKILSRRPLVACFRARGPAPDRAFTFSLASIGIGGNQPDQELTYLSELFRAIRSDGRGEDDVLIVGDFHAGDRGLQPMRKRAGLTWVVSNHPTNTAQFDNLVFNEVATVEFTGRGGVFDFMRHYNLRLDDALSISAHMPVWAEFSVFEGVAPRLPVNQSQTGDGRVADGEPSTQR